MKKEIFSQVRMAYEHSSVELENAIEEVLAPLGEEGVGLGCHELEAENLEGGDDETVVAVRCVDGKTQGRNKDGDWFDISVVTNPADYSVSATYLAAVLETLDIFE